MPRPVHPPEPPPDAAGKLIGFGDALGLREPLSVLIEVRQAPVRLAQPGGSAGQRFGAPLALARGDAESSERALADVVQALQALAPTEAPVVLRGARLLVATLTPAQLQQLARLPQVQAIRPNRTHRQAQQRV
jgi:hypothetical protein